LQELKKTYNKYQASYEKQLSINSNNIHFIAFLEGEC